MLFRGALRGHAASRIEEGRSLDYRGQPSCFKHASQQKQQPAGIGQPRDGVGIY